MSSPTRPGVWLPETVLYDTWGWVHSIAAPGADCWLTQRRSIRTIPDDAQWCPHSDCFPGNRCTVCGRPSGDLDQCGPCLHAATTLDKAIEARTQ